MFRRVSYQALSPTGYQIILQFINVIGLMGKMAAKLGATTGNRHAEGVTGIPLANATRQFIGHLLPKARINPFINPAITKNPNLSFE